MGGSIAGMFHEDTRYISRFVLHVGDTRPAVLTSNSVDHFSAAFFGRLTTLRTSCPRHSVTRS